MIQRIRQAVVRQAKDFERNHEEVQAVNATTLKSASIILMVACAGAFLVSILLPAFYEMRVSYGLWCTAMYLFCLCALRAVRAKRDTLGYLYFMFTAMFLFTSYLSVVASPTYRASIFLGLLPVVPLLILDKSWRVNGFVCAMTLLHTGLSWAVKSTISASEDTLNSAILVALSIFVGESVRRTSLQNFDLQRNAKALSELDFLTGLHNRRRMYELMQRIDAGTQTVSGVLLVDIDYFKDYNDHYGHQAGDDCLRQIGAFLQDFGQRNGLEMFRFGGEEFIGFAFDGNQQTLAALSEELRDGIGRLDIPHVHQKTGRVSVSVGFCAGEGTVRQIIAAADQALYRAKNSGRNRCDMGTVTCPVEHPRW